MKKRRNSIGGRFKTRFAGRTKGFGEKKGETPHQGASGEKAETDALLSESKLLQRGERIQSFAFQENTATLEKREKDRLEHKETSRKTQEQMLLVV